MALPPLSSGLQMKLAAIRKRYNLEPVLPEMPEFATPTPPAPEEPGFIERAGRALAVPKRYLVDLPANLAATAPLRERAERFMETGDEEDAPIPAGELMKAGWVGAPEAHESPAVQHAKGVARGVVGRATDIATDPLNLAVMGTAAGLAKAAPLVSKAMHVGFAGMMAKGTYDAADAAYQEYRRDGWSPAVSEHATEAAVDAGLLTAVAMGLVRRPPAAPGQPPTYEPGGGVAPPLGLPPGAVEAREAPFRRRPRLEEPYIDVEGVSISGAERGLPPPQRLIGPGAPPPPGPPPPSAVPPKAKTPHETPELGLLSQAAVGDTSKILDARIAESEAKGLDIEVGDLVKQQQAIAEAYTVQHEPPEPPAPRSPYEAPRAELIDETTGVKMILKLKQEAQNLRTGGDIGKAAESEAVAESLRAQLKARQGAAAVAPATEVPATAPDARVAAAAPAAAPAAEIPGPRAGTRVETTPEPAQALDPRAAARARVAEQRPAVQDFLDRARTGEPALPEELSIIEGRPPRDLAGPEAAPLKTPAVGGTRVPEPVPAQSVAPVPQGVAPVPQLERLPVAGPPERGPVIEMRRAPAEAQPALEYLRSVVSPDRVDAFEQAAAALVPPGEPWTPETLEPLRGQVDEDVLTAAQTLLASGVPEPEPTVEEVAAKMRPPEPPAPPEPPTPAASGRKPVTPQVPMVEGAKYVLPSFVAGPRAAAPVPRLPPAEEFVAPAEEPGPIQEPLAEGDSAALAGMLRAAVDEQVAAGDQPGLPAQPTAEDVMGALREFDIAVSPTEAQVIADEFQPSAGLTAEPERAKMREEAGRAEEQVGPGERVAEAAPGGALPGELPPAGGEARGGREVRGVPPEAKGALGGDRGPAVAVGEAGALPGGGAGGRRGVPEAEPVREGGAEPGVAVEPAEPEVAREEPGPEFGPSPAPAGTLENSIPAEILADLTQPRETVDAPKDLDLSAADGDVFGEERPWSQKRDDNMGAIVMLKDIEATGRRATSEEQQQFARYAGWGGMPALFDPYHGGYQDRPANLAAGERLRGLLTQAEYESAALSTPNAHYTSAEVVRGIWGALEELGLTLGQRALEPAMGIGNFFTLAPVSLKKTGVELDALTARIAKQIHPEAAVHMMGLEQTSLPDGFYDLVIGNPPFGRIKVFDPAYRSDRVATEAIHNYMILKSLDKARPGGVVALITSRYTLDAKDPAIRQRILDRGDLIAAVRLPNTAFEKNAGTKVVTDILVFRKRASGAARPADAAWLETKEPPVSESDPLEGRPVWRNAVWDTPVGKILGTEERVRGMYGRDEYTVAGSAPTRDQVKRAILGGLRASGIDHRTADGQILKLLTQEQTIAVRQRLAATPEQVLALKPGNFVLEGGKIMQSAGAELEAWEPPVSKSPAFAETPKARAQAEKALLALEQKIGEFIPLRDQVKALLSAQIDPAVDEAKFGAVRKATEKLYDAFVKKHGFIHEQARDLRDDTDFPNVLALEKDYTPVQRAGEGKARKIIAPAHAEKADILKRRVAGVQARAERAESTREAYLIALGESGRLDWDRMAELTSKPVDDVRDEARTQGLVYLDPQTRTLTSAEEYLSGNVRQKLKQATAAAAEDTALQANVDALRLVVPTPKLPAQIHAPLGAGWVPGDHIKGFIEHLLGGERSYSAGRIAPMYLESIAAWQIEGLENALGQRSTAGSSVWGTPYYTAAEAIGDVLNLKTPAVYSKDPDGSRYLDVTKTENAKEIKAKIETAWKDWLWSDKARADQLAEMFNDHFYGTVPRNYDGGHLTLPGMNRSILKHADLYDFQKNAIWMMLQNPNTLVALPVGAGKTYTAIAAIMEARRMGTARKPVVLAPRAVLPQWVSSFKRLYPSSQILYVDPEDMTPRSRGRLMSRIATGDYDAVVVTHEGFQKLPLSQEWVDQIISAELQTLERAFEDILRDKYPAFQQSSDKDVDGYVKALVAWQDLDAQYQRSPEYRKDRKALFIPGNDGAKHSLAEWRKAMKPVPPKPDVSMLRGEDMPTKRLVKQLATAKLNLKAKVAKFADPTRKDRNITFDQLGVDMLVVDEAHYFKRLFFTSKMERVPGLPTDFSERAYDLFMKARLTQQRNGGGGLHFLTGTPLTNTIAEMYNLFRFLDPKSLKENGLEHFDAWAKNYATIATGIEVDPTGSSMRTATRFNKFVNLGSLLRSFRSFTYYKAADELGIERPKVMLNESNDRRPRTVIVPKSELTANYVKFLVKRAQRLKTGGKDVTDDNPLLVTTDGMKAALDMRLIHPDYPDDPSSKLNQATRGIFDRWKAGQAERTTQLVFLDMGTPGGASTMRIRERNPDGSMTRKYDAPKLNLYEDMRKKLVALGVPRAEVEFIHDWSGDADAAAELYAKVNSGAVRILFASSDKGGVGVNVQQRMKHLHHLDVPYTPDKLEQREGRIVRQGNMNPEVEIVNWVSKGTFDIYKWQLVQQKASFISKALSGNLEADEVEDLSFTAMTAEEVIALGSDNPLVRDRLTIQKKLERIERLYHGWQERRRQIGFDLGAKESAIDTFRRNRDVAKGDLAARADALAFKPGIGAGGWKAYDGYLRETTRSIVPAYGEQAKELLKVWQEAEPLLSAEDAVTDRDGAAALLHTVLSAMELVGNAKVHDVTNELIGKWRGLPVVATKFAGAKGIDGYAGKSRGVFSLGDAAKGTLASIESVTGKHALTERISKAEAGEAEARRALEKLEDQAKGEFEHRAEGLELEKQLFDVEEKLGLHKREQGTTQVAATEEPGAGGGGDEPPEPPDPGAPYTDSPDPTDGGGDGPVDPPAGRPDQGAQPGDAGWDARVRGAKARTRARGRGGTANMGVDPQGFWDAVTLGVDALARGVRTFARWVSQVVSGLGGSPGGPMLQRIWRVSQEWFGARTRVRTSRRAARPVAETPPLEPPAAGRKGPKISEEEVRRAAAAAAEGGPAPAWDRPGGIPDTDINWHRVRDEAGLRDLQARMVAELEKSLGRKGRQVRSWAQVRAEAVLSGITESDFNRMLRKKGALTDVEITAGRILRQESAKAVRAALDRYQELKAKAEGASGNELLAQEALEAQREYLATVAQYAAIAADTVAAGSESGRALAAHRMMLESLTPEERYVKRLFRGMEPNEKQIAALTDALMRQDHARIMEVSRQILKPSFLDKLNEYYVNSILSGLATPAANMTGNTIFMGILAGERGFAARLEQFGLRQFLEKMLAGESTPIERVPGEGWATGKALFKMKFGLWRGLVESWNAIRNESSYSQLKGEFHGQAIGGLAGKTIRTPGRTLEAQDLGAKWAVKGAEKAAQVLREAAFEGKRKGWSAEKIEARMKELENELDRYIQLEEDRRIGVKLSAEDMQYLVRNREGLGKMYREMDRVANEATFRDEVMKLTRYVLMARHTYPWLTFLVPFIKTPERILVQAFRRTPVGLAKTLYNIQQGKISGGIASDRLAAGIIGSLASAGLYMLAADGHITGGGPADLDERKNWEKTGKKPYAIKVGSRWISLARLEPLATTLGFAADLAEARNEKTAGDVWDKLHFSVVNNIANKTYLQSLIGAAEALGDPERYGARLQKQIIGALVPNLLASAARAIDPVVRQTDDISSTLLARVPVLSKRLPARLTGTGEAVTRGEDPISRFMSPFRYAEEAGPEANLERLFLETGYNPAAPPKDMTVGNRKVVLTGEERAVYASYASRATAFARTLAKNRDWSGLDVIEKEEILRRIYRFAHDAARRDLNGRIMRRVRAGQYELKEKR
jgi:N12 class adenine-specific DNA methylase